MVLSSLNLVFYNIHKTIWTITCLNEKLNNHVESEIKRIAKTNDEEMSKDPEKKFLASWVNSVTIVETYFE